MKHLLEVVNTFLAQSEPEMKEARYRLASLTTHQLMLAHKYKGFNYNYWLDRGCEEWRAAGRPEGAEKDQFIYGPSGDETRITFYQ